MLGRTTYYVPDTSYVLPVRTTGCLWVVLRSEAVVMGAAIDLRYHMSVAV